MTHHISRRLPWLSLLFGVLFALGFPVMVHFVGGGEMFGAFMIVPLTLVAWTRGRRGGVIAALAGSVFTQAVFSLEYFLVRHEAVSSYWLMITTAPMLVFFFVGIMVGMFGDAHRELESTRALLANTEATAQQYLDIAGAVMLALDPAGRIVMLNRRGHELLGYENGWLIGADYIRTCLPPEVRDETRDALARLMRGEAGVAYRENLVLTRQGERRLVAWRNALLKNTGGHVMGTLSSGEDITERRAAQKALEDNSEHLNAVLNAVPDLLFEIDRQGVFHDVRTGNPDLLLFPEDPPLVGKHIEEVMPAAAAAAVRSAITRAAETGHYMSAAIPITHQGVTHWRELSVATVGDWRRPDCHFVAIARNVSDRIRLEQELVQSQKMESVGRLAGGIAHDFNNILQVILGYCELLLTPGEGGERRRKYVATIQDSAERAASLTMQLLAFSRKQKLDLRIVDVNDLIERSRDMLTKLLGEDIVLMHDAVRGEALVQADAGQLQQVVMNLAVNARDAMPDGGTLRIEVAPVAVAAGASPGAEIPPGDYVELTVSDTGTGMDEPTLAHLFEPFFTTKEPGKGTGLGLSIVYGVVKQSRGAITVQSRPGAGTTFRIWLPRVDAAREDAGACPEDEPRGSETVLMVEDEQAVRDLIQQHLRGCGYTVIAAGDGTHAMELIHGQPAAIDLLITDVVLPGMRGARLAEAFRAANPAGRVLYMSGYTNPPEFAELATAEGEVFLQKPFTLSALSRGVRSALDPT